MNDQLTETKLKSDLGRAWHLMSSVLCLVAVILICANAPAQNLFVTGSDASGGKIFEFTPNGVQNTFASGLNAPNGLAFDSAGNLFVADGSSILRFSSNGARTTFANGLTNALGLAFDSADNLFVAENGTGRIVKFTPDGVRTTFASGLDGPWALAIDDSDNLFVTDSIDVVGPGHANIYKFNPGGTRTTFASGLLAPLALAFDSNGELFALETGDIDGLGAAIFKFTPAGKKQTFASPFLCIGPGLAIDNSDNLFVPDWCTSNIYMFTPPKVQSTFVSGAGLNESFAFLAVQPADNSRPTSTPVSMPNVYVSGPGKGTGICQGSDATFTITISPVNPSQVTTVRYSVIGSGIAHATTISGATVDIPAGAYSTAVNLPSVGGPIDFSSTKTGKVTLKLLPANNYKLQKPKKATVKVWSGAFCD